MGTIKYTRGEAHAITLTAPGFDLSGITALEVHFPGDSATQVVTTYAVVDAANGKFTVTPTAVQSQAFKLGEGLTIFAKITKGTEYYFWGRSILDVYDPTLT